MILKITFMLPPINELCLSGRVKVIVLHKGHWTGKPYSKKVLVAGILSSLEKKYGGCMIKQASIFNILFPIWRMKYCMIQYIEWVFYLDKLKHFKKYASYEKNVHNKNFFFRVGKLTPQKCTAYPRVGGG